MAMWILKLSTWTNGLINWIGPKVGIRLLHGFGCPQVGLKILLNKTGRPKVCWQILRGRQTSEASSASVNFRPTQACFTEISRTHSALVRSFQCINMKLLIKRIIRCCFHTDDVFYELLLEV